MGIELGRDNVCYIHLTLVPYIATAGEMKTKPTQHSVKELREIGIQPDVVLCRVDRPLPEGERRKIALFTNVAPEAVIPAADVDSIYKIPAALHAEGLDEIVCRKLELTVRPADLSIWDRIVDALEHPEHAVHIAMVGKYVDLTESYKSLSEALIHAGVHTRSKVHIHYVDSEAIERDGVDCLTGMDAILVPGGFGKRGVEGKIRAVRFARENRVPYLGICLGMQLAVIECARHRRGAARRQQHRVRSGDAAPGRRADHRVAEPRRLDREALAGVGPRRHDAPGRAALRGRARVARAPGVRQHRHLRAPPPPLRGQQPLPAAAAAGGALRRRPGQERDRRRSLRDDRATRITRGSSAASSTPSSRRRRAAATRSSSASCARRCSASSRPVGEGSSGGRVAGGGGAVAR